MSNTNTDKNNKQNQSVHWNDWHWQMQNRITNIEAADKAFNLSEEEKQAFAALPSLRMPFGVTPYYAAVIKDSPLRKSIIPSLAEQITRSGEVLDPLGEDNCAKLPNLIHRYKDRALFLVSNICPAYCRYCTRGRRVGNPSYNYSNWDAACAYISEHREIRDVLISGGEPLLLSDERLDELLKKLRSIPHVEIIRIGTKLPITLPMRITKNFIEVLKKYPPLYLSIHASHKDEITPQVIEACNTLADNGIQMASQTVLLKGINDNAATLLELTHALLKIRVRPYYLFQCDALEGVGHFRVPVQRALKIVDEMRASSGGFSIPDFAIDLPNKSGKIILAPEHIVGFKDGYVQIKDYTGKVYDYPN